jgi:phosphatidylglycerophosphate synthase
VGRRGVRRYRWAIDRLASAQKSGAGVPAYLRWVNRGLGRRAAAAAYVLGVAPNTVTAASAILSASALVIIALAPVTFATAVIATVLLLAGYALDSADGQLARLTGTGSLAGEWLDHVVDAARLPLFHLAIAIHFFRAGAALWIVGLALTFLLLTSVWFFAQTLAEKLTPPSPSAVLADSALDSALDSVPVSVPDSAPPWASFAKLPYDVGLLYLSVLALALPPLFIAIYTVLFVITAGVAALSLRRKYRALLGATATVLPTTAT